MTTARIGAAFNTGSRLDISHGSTGRHGHRGVRGGNGRGHGKGRGWDFNHGRHAALAPRGTRRNLTWGVRHVRHGDRGETGGP